MVSAWCQHGRPHAPHSQSNPTCPRISNLGVAKTPAQHELELAIYSEVLLDLILKKCNELERMVSFFIFFNSDACISWSWPYSSGLDWTLRRQMYRSTFQRLVWRQAHISAPTKLGVRLPKHTRGMDLSFEDYTRLALRQLVKESGGVGTLDEATACIMQGACIMHHAPCIVHRTSSSRCRAMASTYICACSSMAMLRDRALYCSCCSSMAMLRDRALLLAS